MDYIGTILYVLIGVATLYVLIGVSILCLIELIAPGNAEALVAEQYDKLSKENKLNAPPVKMQLRILRLIIVFLWAYLFYIAGKDRRNDHDA